MDDADTLIDDCITRESRMSEWESNFIDSLVDTLGDGKSLTEKQYEKLNSIWEKVTENG